MQNPVPQWHFDLSDPEVDHIFAALVHGSQSADLGPEWQEKFLVLAPYFDRASIRRAAPADPERTG